MRRRPPHLIELSAQEQQQLESLAQAGRTEQRVARRARILLAMADPATIVEQLAEKVELTRVAIWKLCRRYEELGIDALFDATRPGRPWELSPLAAGRD
jgi:transposase